MSRAARTAPWWLTWLLAGALVSIFLGERVFETLTTARVIFSGLGALLVLACLVWRIFSWRDAQGEAKRVEQILLMAYAGCLLALVLYLISSADGMGWLGIEFEEDESRDRYKVILQVLWPIVMAVSLLPALTAQLAIGAHRHARGVSAGLESLRVTETANGGLVVALACALLFVVCYITVERDKSLDLSYFKTSAPGEATEAVISSLDEPLEVLLFFPAVSEVKDEALRYFRGLAGRTDRLVIHEYDRLASPQVAQEFRVFEDGTIILKKGARSERMSVGATLQNARQALRRLDGDVQRSVLALLRERRTAYLTKGHGELNDSLSAGPLPTGVMREVTALREFLRFLNYEIADLGLQEGLGREIPPDAALLLILGPTSRFLPEELAAVDRYLAEGGALLLALDPQTQFQLGPLEQRLGVLYRGVELADDRQHLRQRDN
ncbi:MAG: Gldg family protein, partial [Gemmatimonadetes bacterium]|nr:Gldg family protein [Gemmatimonadota bacterium]